jgi:hypothetical protein
VGNRASVGDGASVAPDPAATERRARRLAEQARTAEAYRSRHPDVPVVPDLDARILAALEAGGTLDMQSWHTCETTHCRAGWAIHLAGAAGKAIEARLGSQRAGAEIYRASTGRVPHFFATTERALADIRDRAAAAKGTP